MDTICSALRDSGYPEWALYPPPPTPGVNNDPQSDQETGAKNWLQIAVRLYNPTTKSLQFLAKK